MINSIKIFALSILILLLAISSALATETVNEQIINKVTSHYQLNDLDIEIIVRKCRLKSESSEFDDLTIEPLTQGEARGVISVRVKLFKDGQMIEQGQVRLRISHFAYVLTSNHLVRRHDKLSPELFSLLRQDVTYMADEPIHSFESINENWARRNINKDQILTTKLIEKIPLIKQHDAISIVCNNRNFEIIVPGQAMEAGSRGETIKVRNDQSRKIIVATVIDKHTVAINSH